MWLAIIIVYSLLKITETLRLLSLSLFILDKKAALVSAALNLY
ncbi:hypothetical protein THZB04_40243 [Vibrio owensii]|nr:hypothetical protein THZB04_40243 [Vibrio owensii]